MNPREALAARRRNISLDVRINYVPGMIGSDKAHRQFFGLALRHELLAMFWTDPILRCASAIHPAKPDETEDALSLQRNVN